MGLMNSSLQIGRSALLGYDAALQVVGNNISSAASPDYTRLSPQLDPLQGQLLTRDLQPGAGVALTAIQRNIDEALEARLRVAIGAQGSAVVRQQTLTQVEAFFDDLSGTGVGTRLTQFFNAFDELQGAPEERAVRDLVINNGVNLAQSIRALRTQLTRLGEDIDAQIEDLVATANGMADRIARLNEEITTSEAGRAGQATGLRDQRDALLRRLSELFDITVREQPNGTVNVYVGSEAIIQGSSFRQLVAVREPGGGPTRNSVRFADTNQQLKSPGGRLEGLLQSRDQNTQIEALDELAAAVIFDVNSIHVDGQGLVGLTSVLSTNDVLSTDVPLNQPESGLANPPEGGSFFITVTDDVTGTPVGYRIDVDFDPADPTTLDSLAADITSTVSGVTAVVTSDRRLSLTADEGFTFTFGQDGQDARADTSGVLAALGINTFFSGMDARSIEVNDALLDPVSGGTLVAAASIFLSGDGSNARRIAGLDVAPSERLGSTSIREFYASIAGRVAMSTAAARDDLLATGSVLDSLRAQRESISGVNLDEEAIALVKFERAFQSASRFIRVVDDLLAELVLLIR